MFGLIEPLEVNPGHSQRCHPLKYSCLKGRSFKLGATLPLVLNSGDNDDTVSDNDDDEDDEGKAKKHKNKSESDQIFDALVRLTGNGKSSQPQGPYLLGLGPPKSTMAKF